MHGKKISLLHQDFVRNHIFKCTKKSLYYIAHIFFPLVQIAYIHASNFDHNKLRMWLYTCVGGQWNVYILHFCKQKIGLLKILSIDLIRFFNVFINGYF